MAQAIIAKKNPAPEPLTYEQKIWEVFYVTRLHAFDSRTLEDVQANGVLVTGIPDLDDAMKNDWNKRHLTISQMVDLFRRGVSIKLVKPEDSKEIYEIIEGYLARSIDALKTGLNQRDAPLEDFMAMDNLAHSVYQHAKHYTNRDELANMWNARFNAVQPVNMTNLFVDQPDPSAPPEPEQVRTGYAKELRDSAIALRRAPL